MMTHGLYVAGVASLMTLLPCAAQVAEAPSSTFDIVDLEGETIGRVELDDGSDGLLLKIHVEDLEEGLHGLHIHETGRCEPPFASAGAHLAPEGRMHGFLSDDGPHAGDLPNLSVGDDDDETIVHVYAPGLSARLLRDGDGSALMIHAQADDYMTDPSGASGDRIACAAITGAGDDGAGTGGAGRSE